MDEVKTLEPFLWRDQLEENIKSPFHSNMTDNQLSAMKSNISKLPFHFYKLSKKC